MTSEPFRIVVIDDSRSVLLLLSKLVKTVEGCEPIPFSDADAALEWSAVNEADLVIVDYIMPKKDGLAFIEAFRLLPNRDDIPIVMVSGSDVRNVRYMALQQGATDFVNKPIDDVEFVTRLRNLLVMRRHYKETRERAEILRKAKEEVDRAFEQLHIAHRELEATKNDLSEAFSVIEGSIEYASRIQRSVLPNPEFVSSVFSDHFILWDPRDVVGGDIYWCCPWGDDVLLALGDCTGHGVPGAFMTLISTGAFERARSEVEPGALGPLLSRMHQLVQITLKQNSKQGESDDGMELGICRIVRSGADGGGADGGGAGEKRLSFVGARFSLFAHAPGEAPIEIKGDKRGIGYRKVPFTQEYKEIAVNAKPGMRFYMTSDGLIDQIGSEVRRGFGKVRFMEIIADLGARPMAEVKEVIRLALLAHQSAESRRDDVSVVGFQLEEHRRVY
ncbi:hypothetical protein CCP2SC5_160041 [Azospirillaceae bacterium]